MHDQIGTASGRLSVMLKGGLDYVRAAINETASRRLRVAIAGRDLTVADRWLWAGANPDGKFRNRGDRSWSLMHDVAASRDSEWVHDALVMLLGHGADPNNLKPGDPDTDDGKYWAVRLLNADGQRLHIWSNRHSRGTPLEMILSPYLSMRGGIPPRIDHDRSCISWPSRLFPACPNVVELVKVLLEGGADPNVSFYEGRSGQKGKGASLILASRDGPVHYRDHAKVAAVVSLLLAHGADPRQQDDWGWTALMHSAHAGDSLTVAALLAYDDDVNHIAVRMTAVTLSALGQHTALTIGAQQSQHAVVKLLLDHGAEVDHATADDKTALMMAVLRNDVQMAQVLLDGNATPNWFYYDSDWSESDDSDDEGTFPLLVTAERGYLEMTRLLLDYGADPSRASEDGLTDTPIVRSAAHGHLDVLQLLASYGGDLDAETRDGNTVRDILDINQADAMAIHNAPRVGAVDDAIAWLDSVHDLTTLQIAVGCRDNAAIKYVLKHGHDDPANRIVTGLASIAGFPADALWDGAPAVCPATCQLAKAATAGWAPSRHHLFHRGVRESIRVLMLISSRLNTISSTRRRSQRMAEQGRSGVLSPLPDEMWACIGSFISRSDFCCL